MTPEQRAEAQQVMDDLMTHCTYWEGAGDDEARYFVSHSVARAYRLLGDLLDEPVMDIRTTLEGLEKVRIEKLERVLMQAKFAMGHEKALVGDAVKAIKQALGDKK